MLPLGMQTEVVGSRAGEAEESYVCVGILGLHSRCFHDRTLRLEVLSRGSRGDEAQAMASATSNVKPSKDVQAVFGQASRTRRI